MLINANLPTVNTLSLKLYCWLNLKFKRKYNKHIVTIVSQKIEMNNQVKDGDSLVLQK